MFHTFTFLRRDAGHGGSDPGGIGNGLQEKNLTLKIATNIKSLVEDYKDVTVKMSRAGDMTTESLQTLKWW
ncbi:N-acetylmuramoyl-L-alanine amidase [Peribacillus simplex]|uniref:N-acetylmuramoyl-L-alanine amidase n=1 Tax=Peribacillus simplex TaxID=1478 RepID=UPI003D26992A